LNGYVIRADLIKQYPDIHSIWTNDVYNSPASLMHRQENPVKNYAPKKDCQFAREVMGDPLPSAYEDEYMLCIQLVDSV